jgi:hypothetical protein
LGAAFSFPNLKLSIFVIEVRRLLNGISAHRVLGQRCFAVLYAKIQGIKCRTISATNRTMIDSHDAYYFGKVDKISTSACQSKGSDHRPGNCAVNLETPLFSVGFIAEGRAV